MADVVASGRPLSLFFNDVFFLVPIWSGVQQAAYVKLQISDQSWDVWWHKRSLCIRGDMKTSASTIFGHLLSNPKHMTGDGFFDGGGDHYLSDRSCSLKWSRRALSIMIGAGVCEGAGDHYPQWQELEQEIITYHDRSWSIWWSRRSLSTGYEMTTPTSTLSVHRLGQCMLLWDFFSSFIVRW